MTRELEAWEQLKTQYKELISNTDFPKLRDDEKQRLDTIETALKEREQDKKKLEVFEIIKNKLLKIDFKALIFSPDYESYHFFTYSDSNGLTKEEYDILKKVFCHEKEN